MFVRSTLIFMIVAMTSTSWAMPPPQPPPKQAVDACKGKHDGDACQFQLPQRQGNIYGRCHDIAQTLTCVPPPPPPAQQACVGRRVGDSCQFRSPHGRLGGICRQIHSWLACVPNPR